MAGVSNTDRTDREMLLLIVRVLDEDGVASSEDVAEALGLGEKNGLSPAGRVASRLSWMARFGFIERIDPHQLGRSLKPSLWILTPVGERLIEGKLTKAVESALDSADSGSHLLIMRRLVQRAYVDASYSTAVAVRREYQHNAAQRIQRRGRER